MFRKAQLNFGFTRIKLLLNCVGGLVYLILLHRLANTPRTATDALLVLFFTLAALSMLLKHCFARDKPTLLFLFACLSRVLLMSAPPLLSDDYFRFHWDGLKTRNHESPYDQPPKADAKQNEWPLLFKGMNSVSYYSPYPPVCQYIWALTAFSTGDTRPMKLVYTLFDLVNIALIIQLLRRLKKPMAWALMYAFNPLVLIEGVGQLHPEVLLVTFLLWFMLSFERKQYYQAGFAIGLAICTKLTPVFVLILVAGRIPWRTLINLCCIALLTTLVLFYPLLPMPLHFGMIKGIMLYYSQFEFNASVYYMLKSCYVYFCPGQGGQWVARSLGVITIAFTLLLSKMKKRPLVEVVLAFYGVFLLLSAVIHPWYVVPLVALGSIAGYWTPWVWSVLVFLSYSHYADGQFHEHYWLIALEYTLLILAFGLEIYLHQKRKPLTPLDQDVFQST